LGSMEFACKLAGSKIVVVMGHTRCGAVNAACQHKEMGNLTPLLEKIKPAVTKVSPDGHSLSDAEVEKVAIENVRVALNEIRTKSDILAEMEKKGEIELVGAIYSVSTGQVVFFEETVPVAIDEEHK